MTELDLLNLARAATANEISYFTQVITINFAMIVAIYYFLNQARLAMKLFAFVAYLVGMLLFLGEMLLEASMKATMVLELAALPSPSPATQEYLGLTRTWLGIGTAVVANGAFWILVVGVAYLLFFWRKTPEERDVRIVEDRS
ncbi:MAG TPA: hypothetical protein VGB91_09550 [Rhizomicrobium sp.]